MLNYKFQFVIEKDEICTILENSNHLCWKVKTPNGRQVSAPGVMFLLCPPDQPSLDIAAKLKKRYDQLVILWQKKHLKLRQHMILTTINVVKSWDFQQFLMMGKEQRRAIRKALNEDSEKLFQEGKPNDPQLYKLSKEIQEVG